MDKNGNKAPERERRLDEAVAEYLEAEEGGRSPDRDEWLARYTDFAKELKEFFAGDQYLDRLTAPLRPVAATEATVVQEGAASLPSTAPLQALHSQAFPVSMGIYDLLAEIGRGGMGVVYKARQKSPQRLVALKMIRAMERASPLGQARFRAEAEAAAQLDHPHIVPIYEVGELEGQPYFTMKLITGGSLAGREKGFAKEPRRAARVVSQVARAVHHAHQRGILHRDLKPSNILLDAEDQPWVVDFGLAKRLDPPGAGANLTQTGAMIGSPAYMAPEQADGSKGAVTTATDVYGLGALLYALLAGRPPFQGDTLLQVLTQVKETEPASLRGLNPEIDRDLETICYTCLAKEPGKRYVSAEAMADDLGCWLERKPIQARPITGLQRFWRWCGRKPVVAGLSAASGFLALVTIAVLSVSIVWIASEKSQADKARALAEDRENEMRRRLYVDDMKVAKQAWLFEDRDFAVGRLKQWLPQPGREDLRGFEWHHLWKLCHPDAIVLNGHKGDVYHVAYSPDGNFLASAGKDWTVRLWDRARGKLIRTFPGHTDEVDWVSFSPDGETLASCGDDGTIRLWETSTGRKIACWKGHAGEVVAVEFSPDGAVLASGGEDRLVRLWDSKTQQPLAVLKAHANRVESLAFSRTGGLLAAGSKHGTAMVWKIERRGSKLETSPVVDGSEVADVRAVAFNRSGSTLAFTRGDADTRLIDPMRGKIVRDIPTHNMNIGHSLAFSPDDRYLAGCTMRDTIWINSLKAAGETRYAAAQQVNVWSIAYAPDGRQLASAGADGTIRLWDPFEIQNRKLLKWDETTFPGGPGCLCFSRDGKSLAAGSAMGNIAAWNMGKDRKRYQQHVRRPGQLKLDEAQKDPVVAIVFDEPNRRLIAASVSGGLSVFDAETGEFQMVLNGQPEADSMVLSRDRTLFQSSRSGVRYWGATGTLTADGQDIPELLPQTNRFLAAHPAKNQVLVIEPDAGTLRFWDATAGRWEGPVRQLKNGGIRCCLFAPGEQALLYLSEYHGHIRAFDLDAPFLRSVFRVTTHNSRVVHSIAMSPDGRTLASSGGDGTVRLWSTVTGLELYSLDKPPGMIFSLAFSPDGKLLAGLNAESGGVVLWFVGEGPYKNYAPRQP